MLNIKFSQSVITVQQPLDCSLGVNLYLSFSGLVPGNSYILNMESISVEGSVVFDPSSYMFVAASNDVSSFIVKATCQYAKYFIIKSSLLEMSSETVYRFLLLFLLLQHKPLPILQRQAKQQHLLQHQVILVLLLPLHRSPKVVLQPPL